MSRACGPDFPLIRADLSLGQEARGGSALAHRQQHPQNQDIVRHDGAPDILPKARPALPGAAIQTKGRFSLLTTALKGAVEVVFGLGWLFPALAFRRGWLTLAAIVGLGALGLAVQYGMFKGRRTYSQVPPAR